LKKILVISDLHCGHRLGLTPPVHQYLPSYKAIQSKLWDWFQETCDRVEPDILFVCGDAIDGKGGRGGGTELILPDMEDQAACATECIRRTGASKIIMAYGTPYHVTGMEGTDLEKRIAIDVGGEIHDHAMIDVEGVRFSLKHKIGSSGIPHGRATALLRDALWDQIWSTREYEDRKSADVLLRGHVHYHSYTGSSMSLAMTLPCLQLGSTYGSRQCQGTIDYGCVEFSVEEGAYSWKRHLAKMLHKREIVSL